MDIKEYQELSKRTMKDGTMYDKLLNCAMGISGEAGEVTDMTKKWAFQGHYLNDKDVIEELGDVMFYIVNYASTLNIKMEDVLKANVDKLMKRYPHGFSKEDSLKRVDKEHNFDEKR